MATIGSSHPTLFDVASRTMPDGSIAALAELLTQDNQILEDAVFIEGNQSTGHKDGVRTGLPEVYYRSLNAGVPASKSTSAMITEEASLIEGRSNIDIEVLRINGNSDAYRASEDMAFIESMAQRQAQLMIYGNPFAIGTGPVDPRGYPGLALRYSSLSAQNGQNILDAGGSSTDNTSMYLVVWGPNTVFCHYPKGTQAGLSARDLGEMAVQDANLNYYQAKQSLYSWHNGLFVKDWRFAGRIANIDVSDLAAITGTQALTAATNLLKMMARMIHRIPSLGRGRACFYANRTVLSHLAVMSMEKTVNVLKTEDGLDQFGRPFSGRVSFMGVPIKLCDSIANDETRVT